MCSLLRELPSDLLAFCFRKIKHQIQVIAELLGNLQKE